MNTCADSAEGTVQSVNVDALRAVQFDGHAVLTAIWKHPVEGRVPLRGVNLRGDDQADRAVHGGRDHTVYTYAVKDIEW
jgi:MOSC domain-containing protein YiiM